MLRIPNLGMPVRLPPMKNQANWKIQPFGLANKIIGLVGIVGYDHRFFFFGEGNEGDSQI